MLSLLLSWWWPPTTQNPKGPDRHATGHLYLPDTLASWPWPRSVNPHYETVAAESLQWLHSYNFFPAKAQLAFDRCNYEHIRIGCDLMNVFFVIEDGTDDESPAETTKRVRLVTEALRNPTVARPEGEWGGVEIARAFWHRATSTPGVRPATAARFLRHFEGYLQAVATEAADRAKERLRGPPVYTLDSFLHVRRRTVGALPSFVLLELGLPAHVDDESITAAADHPLVRELASVATDMILIGNDLVSYDRERASGAVHNIVTVVLKNPPDKDVPHAPPRIETVQDSVDWVAAYHQTLLARFLGLYEAVTVLAGAPQALPGMVATPLLLYADGLGNWVRANDQWSFESVRYFGANGGAVQATRRVELVPMGV
ncbi:hypothetical protein SPBR_04258 [Sporothrix brasiliensis 5110]|uniref:Terpene synthase n=1 Tax=Sporothrix brasiliensis 5110 TaxID=1398154 RepID=A0A0C2IW61_9PEZI|nr:uncharacterized protein SPBR_04258 [Sporothrix brasiliensis 5110]KIH93396.1 hypothetical protein SPBR_04258 [Sporothrix brasiliensis 5110]